MKKLRDLAEPAGCPYRARQRDQGAVRGGLAHSQVILRTSPDSEVRAVEWVAKGLVVLKLEGVGFRLVVRYQTAKGHCQQKNYFDILVCKFGMVG